MRILALVPGEIGEQILFFPTLEDLKKQYPTATIDVIVEPRAKSAYRICPHVDEVLTFDYKDRNGLADYLNLLGIIRDREYDIALSLAQRWTVGLLLWLNGIPVRIGYKTKTAWFLSNTVPLKTEQYEAHTYHDILQGLNIQSPCPELKVTLPKEDIDWAEAEQKRLDIKESGYILLYDSDASTKSDRAYPISQWQKIIDDIQQKQPDIPIVLLQDSQNAQWRKLVAQDRPNLKVTSPSDVGKMAAIIAGANFLICPESAPMHLSVAVGTYTFALLNSLDEAKKFPTEREQCIGIESPSSKIADIKPETVLAKIWSI
jgi:ADP-heptose:LPS heptosyltransferase